MGARPVDVQDLGVLNALRSRKGFSPLTLDANHHLVQSLCSVCHPQTSSCYMALARFAVRGFLGSIKLYLPVFLIPLVLFRFKSLISNPLPNLQYVVQGTARSSIFLVC
jgi:hypothetical protein